MSLNTKSGRQIRVSNEVYKKILKARVYTKAISWSELMDFFLKVCEENIEDFKKGYEEIDLSKVIKIHYIRR